MATTLARNVATKMEQILDAVLVSYYSVNPINDHRFAIINGHRACNAQIGPTSKWYAGTEAIHCNVDGSGHAIVDVTDLVHDKDICVLDLDGAGFIFGIRTASPYVTAYHSMADAIQAMGPGTTWNNVQHVGNIQVMQGIPRPGLRTPPTGVNPDAGQGGILPVSDRKLVVYEAAALTANKDSGRLVALDPGNATGVPIPAFTYGTSRPATGSIVGQAFISTVTGIASVWNGRIWTEIAVPVLKVYQDDATLLADTPPDDMVAISSTTGNFFVRVKGVWKALGVQTYPTAAGLIADQALDGTIAMAQDTRQWFVRLNARWSPASVAIATAETDITSGTAPWDTAQDGSMVMAQDTGRLFVWANNAWQGSPIRSYATEALLKADTPSDGVLGLAQDSGLVFARMGGAWVRVNASPTIVVGTTRPAAPSTGDIFFNTGTNASEIYDGTNWQVIGTQFRSTVGGSAHGSPNAGDIYWDTDRGGYLCVYDGSNWVTAANPYIRQDADPSWGSSNYGRIWEDTDGGAVYIAAATKWRPIVQWMDGEPSVYGLRVPGYFNKDPDDTSDVNDIIGVKTRYYGSQFQFWGRKGTSGDWKKILPWQGHSNNADKLVLADSEGWVSDYTDMTWTQIKAGLPSSNVASSSATQNWHNHTATPTDGVITVYQGIWHAGGNAHILICMEKTGGRFANNELITGTYIAAVDLTNSTAQHDSWNGGGGGGNGWYSLTYWNIKNGTQAFFEITVNRIGNGHQCLRAITEYTADNGHPVRCQTMLTWNQANTPFTGFYLSSINGSGSHVAHMKQIA